MKFLFYIIIFVVAYYTITKYLFPFLLRVFLKKAQEKFTGFQQNQPHEEIKKEGEVSVKYVPHETKKSKFNPETTEDVDFEEIKEE